MPESSDRARRSRERSSSSLTSRQFSAPGSPNTSAENQKTRAAAEEAERSATIRAELQKLGVAKVDLAFRAVKEEITRSEDGRLIARGGNGEVGLKDYLTQFVAENPELLPARMAGGSGAGAPSKTASGGGSGVSLDQIRPGMSPEELQRVREEISRVAAQTLRGR